MGQSHTSHFSPSRPQCQEAPHPLLQTQPVVQQPLQQRVVMEQPVHSKPQPQPPVQCEPQPQPQPQLLLLQKLQPQLVLELHFWNAQSKPEQRAIKQTQQKQALGLMENIKRLKPEPAEGTTEDVGAMDCVSSFDAWVEMSQQGSQHVFHGNSLVRWTHWDRHRAECFYVWLFCSSSCISTHNGLRLFICWDIYETSTTEERTKM